MNKTDIIADLFNHFELSKADAKTSVEVITSVLTQSIASGEGAEIRGFGGFYRRHRPARLGVNPKTNEKTQVEEKFAPFFKPGKALREGVKDSLKGLK